MSTDTTSTKASTEEIKSESARAAQSLKEETAQLAESARDATESLAHQKAEQARDEVSARADTVESAVSDIAATLSEHSDTLGHYATEFADSLSTFNDRIKNRSLDELASDARTLARNNPAMFVLGAVTIGAVAARFFQASQPAKPASAGRVDNAPYRSSEANTLGDAPGSFNTSAGGSRS